MKQLIIIVYLFTRLNCFGQYSIEGKIIDWETKEPLPYTVIAIYNQDQNTPIKVINSDVSGNLYCDSLNVGTYKIEIFCVAYTRVVINQIKVNEDIDLCNISLCEGNYHWDGYQYKKIFFGLFKKKIKGIGGYNYGYLDKNSIDKKIILYYFCNQVIEGQYSDNVLTIDYKNK